MRGIAVAILGTLVCASCATQVKQAKQPVLEEVILEDDIVFKTITFPDKTVHVLAKLPVRDGLPRLLTLTPDVILGDDAMKATVEKFLADLADKELTTIILSDQSVHLLIKLSMTLFESDCIEDPSSTQWKIWSYAYLAFRKLNCTEVKRLTEPKDAPDYPPAVLLKYAPPDCLRMGARMDLEGGGEGKICLPNRRQPP